MKIPTYLDTFGRNISVGSIVVYCPTGDSVFKVGKVLGFSFKKSTYHPSYLEEEPTIKLEVWSIPNEYSDAYNLHKENSIFKRTPDGKRSLGGFCKEEGVYAFLNIMVTDIDIDSADFIEN